MIPSVDKAAQSILESDKGLAIKFLTDFSVNLGNNTVAEWRKFYGHLFARFMDGNVKEPSEVPEGYIYYPAKVKQPGYPEWWLRKIAEDTGDKLKVPGPTGH